MSLKRILVSLAASLLLITSLPLDAYCMENEKVTVAYIDYNNFIYKAPDGSYTGYGADYLACIAGYTGRSYEFVEMDWPEAYEKVKRGEIDFYCVARQTEEREPDFDFSLYPVCNEEMNIYTMPQTEMYYEDFSVFNGKKVGMLENSSEIEYFRQYAADNGFECDIIGYPMNETAVEAMHNGEVDMIALVNYSVSDEYKLIGNFGVSPAYMMSCENSKYMKEFSKAQEKLYFDEPLFAQKLESIYYGDMRHDSDLLITRDEAEYVESIKQTGKPVVVALSDDMAPIEYFDEDSQTYKGVTVDIFERIHTFTGIDFAYVHRGDAPELTAMMSNGEVTLVGAMAKSRDVEQKLSLIQSQTFADNTFLLVCRDFTKLSDKSTAALPAGYPKFRAVAQEYGYTEFIEYNNFEECVKAVNDGKADLTFIISMCDGYLLDHAVYSDLQTMDCADEGYGICIGAYNACDERMISVINKTIAAVSDREISEMVISNTADAKPRQTITDFIVKNGAAVFAVVCVIILMIAIAVIRAHRAKQQAEMTERLKRHHDFLQHLYDTLPCGVFRYEYEEPHKILSYNAACARIYGYEDDFPVIGKTPDAVVEAGTEDDFRKKFDECAVTGGRITYIWPVTRRDGTQAFTESVLDIVETDDGKVFQEVIIDVTERISREKKIEQRYIKELHRRDKRNKNLIYTACFDFTEQLLTETDITSDGIHIGMSVDEFTEVLRNGLNVLETDERMAEFSSCFTSDKMEREYENGHYEHSFDLCRSKDGHIQWLRSDLVLRRNPANGHLMCFDYIRDVTDDRVTNSIARHMAFADCEYFMSIYLPTGRCLQYAVEKSGEAKRSEADYGSGDLLYAMSKKMTDDDAETYRKATELCVITEQLKENVHYQVYATLYGDDNERSDKSLTYFYSDKRCGVLSVTVCDVTEIRSSEVRHAQLLSDALEAAEKADAAKSQFLSRVSHEMRTPLNAIIGFIELAKDADAEKTANCLASSDIAAKQLLNVINDVLDMSSIESGKMKISNASFNFRHLVTAISNIYGAQCKQKGVTFETRITTPVDDWLVGDELRVNQILMNLLSNAVKFTSEGHIYLTISQTSTDDSKIFIRFAVTDTGCGMSEQMKSRLFKPFEQESASTARKYGGNGLGMSIVKNLVGLMDGSIVVETAPGKGTSFTVDLPFIKSDDIQHFTLPRNVESLHILTVDDEPAEREYMSLVLKRMGVRFTSVCGGEEALSALTAAEKANDLFNVCLIDWRMPGMNGCETTKRIRERYGKELVVIVVSAYDFLQAGETAAQAGANLFLSKPIFQSSLFDLFMTLTDGKIAQPKDEPQVWDFTGKRILLAEDNALNQIVAKGYLSKNNVVVEVADNGQIAVDMFTSSDAGYYDAILMDVQMPVMDGFEATKAIRASSHPQAKTICIIAQSADAFNEDITRCLSAGMNAHVAKPIKPDILSKALYKAFEQNKYSEE